VSRDVAARACVYIYIYVKVYRYNPKHLYPKLNGYGDGLRKVGLLAVPNTATCTADASRDSVDDLESGMQC